MLRTIVLAALLAGGCGINEDVYNAKVNELTKTQAELDQTKKDGEAAQAACAATQKKLNADNRLLKDKLAALGQDVESKSSDLAAAKKRMEELERAQVAAEKRAQQYNEMVRKFRSMIDAGKLQVEVRNGLMLVKLPDNILFDPGKTELKPEGKEAIKQVTAVLGSIEGRKFQVTGHTDNVPIKSHKFKSNWELSTARAVEVVKLMMESGMEGKRLSAAGYADELPVAKNDTEDGRKQNRRIEIVVQPNIEDLPPAPDMSKSS
jgi:chemotaxis protein MotB